MIFRTLKGLTKVLKRYFSTDGTVYTLPPILNTRNNLYYIYKLLVIYYGIGLSTTACQLIPGEFSSAT